MKLKKMNDEQCLEKFLEFLNERVEIETIFVQQKDTGVITHQVLKVTCGDLVTISEPEELATQMVPLTEVTIN